MRFGDGESILLALVPLRQYKFISWNISSSVFFLVAVGSEVTFFMHSLVDVPEAMLKHKSSTSSLSLVPTQVLVWGMSKNSVVFPSHRGMAGN